MYNVTRGEARRLFPNIDFDDDFTREVYDNGDADLENDPESQDRGD